MPEPSRARSAGRRFGAALGHTGMAMAGGAVYYGVHAMLTPTLYGTDTANIPKRCWWLPVAGVIGGGLLTAAEKVAPVGYGIAGGATAIGIEQIQLGVSIKKNAAIAPSTTTTQTGALLEPNDVRSLPPKDTGYEEDAGALWGAANVYRGEAAGLSL